MFCYKTGQFVSDGKNFCCVCGKCRLKCQSRCEEYDKSKYVKKKNRIKKKRTWKSKLLIILITTVLLGGIVGLCILAKAFLFSEKDKKNSDAKKVNTYEFFIQDCTWEEAYEFCILRGGSLVTIDTREEYDELLKSSYLKEYKDTVFYIGGKRSLLDDEYYWIDSNRKQYGSLLNSADSWCKDIWFDEEPSFSYMQRGEVYMALNYLEAGSRWGFNDIENNLISRSSYYAGKIGFICEYDSEQEI